MERGGREGEMEEGREKESEGGEGGGREGGSRKGGREGEGRGGSSCCLTYFCAVVIANRIIHVYKTAVTNTLRMMSACTVHILLHPSSKKYRHQFCRERFESVRVRMHTCISACGCANMELGTCKHSY